MINPPSSLVSNVLRCALSGLTKELLDLLEKENPKKAERQVIATILLSNASLTTLLAIQDKDPKYKKEFEDFFRHSKNSSVDRSASFCVLLTTCEEKPLKDSFDKFLEKREYINAMHVLEALQYHNHAPPSFSPKSKELLSFSSHRFVSSVIQGNNDLFKMPPWSNLSLWFKQNNKWGGFLDNVKEEIKRREENYLSNDTKMALESLVIKISLEHELFEKGNISLETKSSHIKKM